MSNFQVQVYGSPANTTDPARLIADWSRYVSALKFASSATSGWAECTFTLKLPFEDLLAIVEKGDSVPTFIGKRLTITGESHTNNNVLYEGLIYNLSLSYGSANLSRSADQLYTVAQVDFTAADAKTRQANYSTSAARTRFGIKVYKTALDGTTPTSSSAPLSIATRFFSQHSYPPKSDSKTLGGEGDAISLEVSCVGQAATLGWRYATNGTAVLQDTGEIVEDMIQAGAVAVGNDSGNGKHGWIERLTSSTDSSNDIPYASQFITTANFNNIQTTGVTINPLSAGTSGYTRLEIIQAAAEYGNSNNHRVCFQVWERTPVSPDGKGVAYFVGQPWQRSSETGYTGYFDNAKHGWIKNTSGQRLNLWEVRAGRWTTGEDLPSQTNFTPATALEDSRMFWIEHAEYDVDAGALTLATSTEFSLSLYVGRMMNGKRVIREA